MKIYLDQTELFEINATRLSVFCSEINEDNIAAYLTEKLRFGFDQQYQWAFTRFKTEWDAKLLAEGTTSIPLSPDAYAQMIFAREDYKSAKQKEAAAI
jgi:hypothetical protein